MNIQILAERKGKALNKIAACAKGVSKATGAPDYLLEGLVVTNKDKDVEAMLRMEAVAELLEWLRGVQRALTPSPLPNKNLGEGEREPMSDVDQILALPAAKVIEFVETQADSEYLDALLSGEEAGKKRKSVLTAIAARAETVTTAPTPTEPTPDQTLTPSLSPGLPPKKWTRKKGESGKLNGKEARK
ncbi:hypothetical protein LARV_02671 [Longilinea arvoryzae]|uniref:Uncharacterized protein n=1 Tax=Longilinea arvoryzae TaxID=360412 RepID=A0A0S7BAZ5_9CHLR|nr:hypothetical protein [Longilinea arvoryzae]GAP14892.1 hypothetical protein LARV_02671 [Longilinea arvoryzae]